VTTGIWKAPVDGPVAVAGVNLAGDDQADRRVHGGPDKAVYAYAVEDYRWWAEQDLGSTMDGGEGQRDGDEGDGEAAFGPGTFGENLTTEGLDLTGATIGDRWTVGDVVLEVAQPRQPCFKLGIRMGDDHFPGRFERARRPGAYLRILREGSLAAGDAVHVEPADAPHIPLATLVHGDAPDDLLEVIATDPRVPEGWRRSAARALR
jgi:MOSC domain-containing protein YiiM